MARILVAYYSRSGTTRRAAAQIADALGADLEEIRDRRSRSGPLGYLRSSLEGILEAGSDIEHTTHDPAGYDVVVLGTPTWFASLSSPVRSFIWRHRDALKTVAFFCTCGGRGAERALGQMARVSAKDPVAELMLREADVIRGSTSSAIRGFADGIERKLNGQRRVPVQAGAPTPVSH